MSTTIETTSITVSVGGVAFIVIAGFFILFFAAHVFNSLSSELPTRGSILMLGFAVTIAVGIVLAIAFNSVTTATEETQAAMTNSIATRLEVTELTPLDEPIRLCMEGSAAEGAEYTWVNKYGENVKGSVLKGAEAGGHCEYELVPDGF